MDNDLKRQLDERVNEYAEQLYHLRSTNIREAEHKNLFSKLCEAIIQYIPLLANKYRGLENEKIWNIVIDLLYYEFPPDMSEKWNPGNGPFIGCFLSLCNKRLKGCLKKESTYKDYDDQIDANSSEKKKNRKPIRVYSGINEDTGEEIEPWASIRDNTIQLENELESPAIHMPIMERFMHFMNEAVKVKIMQSPNKFCYIQRFYTEWCARRILEPEFSDFRLLVSEVPGKCLDLQFASCFLDNQVSTASEIQYRKLKMLSEFTGSDKDKATPCGFDLKNAVYVQYVMQVTGRTISDSIVSNHREAFNELLTMQSGKIGIGNHPIAES